MHTRPKHLSIDPSAKFPNKLRFDESQALSFLTICGHTGWLALSTELFRKWRKDYGITKKEAIEHIKLLIGYCYLQTRPGAEGYPEIGLTAKGYDKVFEILEREDDAAKS